jgi:hypothetical protein
VKDKNQEWIYIDRDVLALQAANDMAATEAEITTSLLLVLMEDVPGFVIQVLFCFLAFTKEQLTLQDPVLVLTVVTTLLHLCKHLDKVWQLQCDLPRLRREAEERHKVFGENATDAEVLAFASSHMAAYVRKVKLPNCGKITNVVIQALAKNCPCLMDTDLKRCSMINDAAVQALAERSHGLTSVSFCDCPDITDAGDTVILHCR